MGIFCCVRKHLVLSIVSYTPEYVYTLYVNIFSVVSLSFKIILTSRLIPKHYYLLLLLLLLFIIITYLLTIYSYG